MKPFMRTEYNLNTDQQTLILNKQIYWKYCNLFFVYIYNLNIFMFHSVKKPKYWVSIENGGSIKEHYDF